MGRLFVAMDKIIKINKPNNTFGSDNDETNLYSYSSRVLQFLSYVANDYFWVVDNQSVLEIGPATGWFTHTLTHCNPKKITAVERYENFLLELKQIFNNNPAVELINDDIFYYLMHNRPQYDVVVALGVIYHFTDPIGLLEKIANYCKPKYIVLDSPDSILNIVEEPGNPGDRQNEPGYVSSGVTVTIPVAAQKTVLENLGYCCIKQTDLSSFGIQSKEESIIMLFERTQND